MRQNCLMTKNHLTMNRGSGGSGEKTQELSNSRSAGRWGAGSCHECEKRQGVPFLRKVDVSQEFFPRTSALGCGALGSVMDGCL